MSIGAQYVVICKDGGYLVPGQPMICHRVAAKFTTPKLAHRTALSVGWVSPDNGKTHYCPGHTPGGHIHTFTRPVANPIGPVPPGADPVTACPCGAQSHWPNVNSGPEGGTPTP